MKGVDEEFKNILFKVYGTFGCGNCFNQWRIIQEEFFDFKREKVNCNELDEDELNNLKIRQVPVVMIYDGDTLIKRYNEYTSTDTIRDFLYDYKKTKQGK